jgi:excisionase family DNA binding protein
MQTQHLNDSLHNRLGYSVTEAASVLGLAPSGLWKWIALGKIRSVKIGNRRLISAHELQRLLTEGLQ